jgi:hypothetical protein
MLRKFSTIIFLSVLLMGCQQQRREAANHVLQDDITTCRHGESLSREHVLEQIDCMSEARRKWAYAIGANDEWIMEKIITNDRQSAQEYADGEISKETFKTALQRHWSDAAQLETEYQQQRRQNALQALSYMQNSPVFQPQSTQPYVMPVQRNTTTNCYAYGNSLNCNSYGR